MSLTNIIRPIFTPRLRKLDLYQAEAEVLQRGVLKRLLGKAAETEWGRTYGFSKNLSYEDFARQTPLNTYEELKGYIDRMRHGEKDVLGPEE